MLDLCQTPISIYSKKSEKIAKILLQTRKDTVL